MRKTVLVPALAGTLTAAAVAVAAGTGVAIAASPAPQESNAVYLIACDQSATEQPTSFTLACGDGNSWLDDVRWTTWGGDTATGTASVHVVEYDADTAKTFEQSWHAHITAGDAATRGSARAYTKLKVVSDGDQPADAEAAWTEDLSGRISPANNR